MNERQTRLVAEVAKLAGLDVLTVGSPGPGLAGGLAPRLEAQPADDLRTVLTAGGYDLVWLADPGNFGVGQDPADAAAVSAAHARGMRLATLEPVPAGALHLTAGGWLGQSPAADPVRLIAHCPSGRATPPLSLLTDMLDAFGSVASMAVLACGRPEHGSLGAQLYAGISLVLALMGEPESVDASFAHGGTPGPLHVLPGESLRDLHGNATVHLRFADGRSACVLASDRGGRWMRSLTLIGPGGRMSAWDTAFEWVAPDGQVVDRSEERKRPRQSLPARAIADSLRLLDRQPPGTPWPGDPVAILATAQAALLSARTGQGESPATIRHMGGAA